MNDQDFGTALFGAMMREGGALAQRGMGRLSSQTRTFGQDLGQFILIRCKPLSAHLFLVHPDGSPHEYYRETEDELSDGFADVVREFVTSGVNELSVAERQGISKRVEQEQIRFAVLIEADSATIRCLALGPGGDLIGSEELFQLVCGPVL